MDRRVLSLASIALASLLVAPGSSYAQFRGWGHGAYNYQWYAPGADGLGWSYFGNNVGEGGYLNTTPTYNYPSYNLQSDYVQPYVNATPLAFGSSQQFYPVAPSQAAQNPARDRNRGYIHVRVPANAKVLFEDSPTTQTGSDRTFMTGPLDPNMNYTYNVSARWTENGHVQKQSRSVRLIPGQTVNVDFTTPASRDQQSTPASTGGKSKSTDAGQSPR